MLNRTDRIEGGIWGLLIGDAVGVPYEFRLPNELPPLEQLDMFPPDGFLRTYADVRLGTWSDDGAQALCLFSSLIECGRWDAGDFADRLVRWYQKGYLAVNGYVFDIGIQTGLAIRKLLNGMSPEEAGLTGERNNGNGSLMRVLPLALIHHGSDAELVERAHAQSRLTHRHPRSLVCCALYSLWARRELGEVAAPWDAAVESLRKEYELIDGEEGEALRAELEHHVLPAQSAPPKGTGYVVDSLFSARQACMQGSDYRSVIQHAVALGNDTDTTACIAGGIAGIRHGLGGIPQAWVDALLGKPLLLPLLRNWRGTMAEQP